MAPQTDPAIPEAGSSGISIVPESRFMQNYRIASAVHGGSCTSAIVNGQGNVELFTSGTDTLIWNFYADPGSDTGTVSTSTGVAGEILATGLTPGGDIVLFAAQGTNLTYAVEQRSGSKRWGQVKLMDVPLPSRAIRIARIYTAQIAGALYIGVMVETKDGTYSFSYGIWGGSAPTALNRTGLTLQSLNGTWTGSSADTAAFSLFDNIILRYHVATGQVEKPAIAATFHSIDVGAANDAAGNTQVLAVLADGNAYQLLGGDGRPYSWGQLTTGASFKQLALLPSQPALDALFLGDDNRLYHTCQVLQSPGSWQTPLPIHSDTQSFAATLDDGNIELFAIGAQQNTVTQLTRGSASGNWEVAPLELVNSGAIEDFSSYTTDVALYDAVGAPLGSTAVQVWAEDACRLAINGGVYYVTPARPARLQTNAAGTLSISQQTSSLAAPAVMINVTGQMSPGESIVIRQNAQVQDTLEATDGKALMAATLADGSPLLTGQYHEQTTADSVAQAVSRCMTMTDTAYQGATPGTTFLNSRRPRPGVSLHTASRLPPGALLRNQLPEQHWQLSVRDGRLLFRDISADEARGTLMYLRSSTGANGFFDWIKDIGDFIAGVAEGIIKVVDYVVTTVVEGIQAAFHFIVDGVTYLFETIVDTVEKAFDLAESVFAAVKVFFQQLYEWLGFLFNWGDILRTRDALAYTINTGLDFLSGAVGGIQKKIDGGIDTLQRQLQQWFDQAKRDIAGPYSLGGYEQANTPDDPNTSQSVANNIVFSGLVNNAGAATCTMDLAQEIRSNDSFTDFFNQLTQLVDFTESTEAFSEALDYISNLGTSPDQIFRQLLAALMSVVEGVIQAIISGVQVVIDALFLLVQALVQTIKGVLNAEWNIPFVSQLYSLISGGKPLTTLDLISLILAVPGTILYKILQNAAPFPDDASVARYKASFNAQTLLAATGLGGTKAKLLKADANGWTGLLPREFALVTGVLGSVAYFFYGSLTALTDALPPDQAPPAVIGYTAFLLELGAQICCCPWFLSAGTPACDNADGAGRTLWIYMWVGIGLDLFFLGQWKRMPENKDDIGVAATFIYGLGHVGLSIPASLGQSGTVVAMNVMPSIPEVCKLLRLTKVATATKGISLLVQSGIDFICYTSTTVLTCLYVADATKPPTQSTAPAALPVLPA